MMQKVHFRLTSVAQKRCCLNNDNDDGSENVAKKMNLPSFNLNRTHAAIWTHFICQMQATFPGVELLRILFKFKKRKENSTSNVHVLHKTSY